MRISETTKGKGAGCRGTVQKITKSYTFILPQDDRGEVRAQHRFIEVVEKNQSKQSDLNEFRMRNEEDKSKRARQAEERQERMDQAERTRQAEERQERSQVERDVEGREREVAAARTQAREIGRERDRSLLNEIIRNQEYMLEKMRALDVKQEMLTIESRNLHVMVTDLQTNVQEIHVNVLGQLQGQVKALCRHLPMVRQNMHSLIRTNQSLDMIANKVGIGGDILTDDGFYSVTGVEEHHEKMGEFAM